MTRLVPRLVALGLAGVLAVATLAPASAATRKHHAAPAQQADEGIFSAPVAAAPHAYAVPTAPGFGPNACISDEGYGRYSSCDGNTSN